MYIINIEKELLYRKAFEKWLEENSNKTINDVPYKTQVKLIKNEESIIVNLGIRINTIKGILRGKQAGILTKSQQEYWLDKYGLTEEYNTNSKYINTFNDNEEKSKKIKLCIQSLKNKKKKKSEYNIDNILKEFNVDLDTLNKYLNRTKHDKTVSSPILMKDNETLSSYCIKNGFNYDVIKNAIKLHQFCSNDNLEQLINRAIINYSYKNQKEPSTWVYEKYGILVKHILLY